MMGILNLLRRYASLQCSGDMLLFFISSCSLVMSLSLQSSSVRITPSLWWRGWCDWKAKYWSVWVFLRNTDTSIVPSDWRVALASSMGRALLCSSSQVTWMLPVGSTVFKWAVRRSDEFSGTFSMISSTNLSQPSVTCTKLSQSRTEQHHFDKVCWWKQSENSVSKVSGCV